LPPRERIGVCVERHHLECIVQIAFGRGVAERMRIDTGEVPELLLRLRIADLRAAHGGARDIEDTGWHVVVGSHLAALWTFRRRVQGAVVHDRG
jgi:hypothetical protein